MVAISCDFLAREIWCSFIKIVPGNNNWPPIVQITWMVIPIIRGGHVSLASPDSFSIVCISSIEYSEKLRIYLCDHMESILPIVSLSLKDFVRFT